MYDPCINLRENGVLSWFSTPVAPAPKLRDCFAAYCVLWVELMVWVVEVRGCLTVTEPPHFTTECR
jgi:hypothetical protein